jgi:hypothetical protein
MSNYLDNESDYDEENPSIDTLVDIDGDDDELSGFEDLQLPDEDLRKLPHEPDEAVSEMAAPVDHDEDDLPGKSKKTKKITIKKGK